jgi:hypothetical protein
MSRVNLSEQSHSPKLTKIERYGWIVKDTPGVMMLIDKRELQVNHEYQRHLVPFKVTEMSARWSWVACGTLTVGMRAGQAWVIDGQHRLAAALRRSDITNMPCIVFDLDSIQDEARGFLSSNTLRKTMTAVDKFRASVVAGDEAAIQFAKLCDELGLTITATGNSPNSLKAATWGRDRMEESPSDTRIVLTLAADIALADGIHVSERLLQGLWYIHRNTNENLLDAKLRQRIKKIGAKRLLVAVQEARNFFDKSGERIYATGMLQAINKGLRQKYAMRGDAAGSE